MRRYFKIVPEESDSILYSFTTPTDADLFNEFNKFLDVSIRGKFNNYSQFKDWLYGQQSIEFIWPTSIDNKDAQNDDNTNLLWRSMLAHYAIRLNLIAPSLQQANANKLYPSAFDKLMAPTGRANAPYFIYIYFNGLQSELYKIEQESNEQKSKRELLRSGIPLALGVAGGAYGYFISIMFLFLMVSIEASARSVAESERTLAQKQGAVS